MKYKAHAVRAGTGIVLAWILAAFLLLAMLFPSGDIARAPWLFVVIGVVVGLTTGVLSALFELTWLPRFVRRLSSAQALAFWTAFYVAVALLVIGVVSVLGVAARQHRSIAAVLADPALRDLFTSAIFWESVGGLVLLSFLVNLGRQVRLVLGPDTTIALLFGRYRRPVAEELVFMFVDLTGSTGLAQRLGPARFNDFKNDFFADVAQAVLETGGRIYQYVGDEVVVTWPVRRGQARGNALDAFLGIEANVRASVSRYERQYGVVPTFKAGAHAGQVVTAEVGYVKKDIVHSGDVVNVTARIEGQCHAFGARLLVSEEVLQLLALPAGATAEDVGVATLRGRDGGVHLFRVACEPASPSLKQQRSPSFW